MKPIFVILIALGALAVGVIVGFILRMKSAEKKIGSAKRQAMQILEDAMHDAESRKKEILFEAKENALTIKDETERDLKERRKEVARQENRLAQKEENLDRKIETLEKKENRLTEKEKEAEELKARIQSALAEQRNALERISGITAEDAKAELLARVESEIAHETAQKISEYETRFKEEGGGCLQACTGKDRVSFHTGGAPALRPGAIAQSPGREANLSGRASPSPAQLLAFAPGKEQAAGVWEP